MSPVRAVPGRASCAAQPARCDSVATGAAHNCGPASLGAEVGRAQGRSRQTLRSLPVDSQAGVVEGCWKEQDRRPAESSRARCARRERRAVAGSAGAQRGVAHVGGGRCTIARAFGDLRRLRVAASRRELGGTDCRHCRWRVGLRLQCSAAGAAAGRWRGGGTYWSRHFHPGPAAHGSPRSERARHALQNYCFQPHDGVLLGISTTASTCACDGLLTGGVCSCRWLPGERPARFAGGSETLSVCPTCDSGACVQGLVRAAPETSAPQPGDSP